MKKNTIYRLPVLDIYHASFLMMNGFVPDLILEGERVVFSFPVNDEIHRLCREYGGNPAVPVLDFVMAVRQLRSKMLSLKKREK